MSHRYTRRCESHRGVSRKSYTGLSRFVVVHTTTRLATIGLKCYTVPFYSTIQHQPLLQISEYAQLAQRVSTKHSLRVDSLQHKAVAAILAVRHPSALTTAADLEKVGTTLPDSLAALGST